MEYNKNQHLKLLKSQPKPKNTKKSLSLEGFIESLDYTSEPDENFFQLQKYSAMMICHLQWENREQYFELIEKLLNGPIGFLELRKKYRAIADAGERLQAELILLEPNPKSEGFDDLISEIVLLFDRFCPDPSLRESNEFSEEELKKLIQKIFIQMKDRYP